MQRKCGGSHRSNREERRREEGDAFLRAVHYVSLRNVSLYSCPEDDQARLFRLDIYGL